MKKWIYIVVSVLVLGFFGYQWYGSKSSSQEVSAQVRTAVVQKGKLEVKISGSGTVQPVTSEDIKSMIDNNEIDKVLVAAGAEVSKGDELVTFTDGSDPITAPADGTVTTVGVVAGERVTSGQVVVHLTNYKDLQTVVQVDELDIAKIKKDQPVSLTLSGSSDQTYTGKVTAIAAEGTSSNGVSTFDVTVHFDKPGSLKVGMSTEAFILTDSKAEALFVPVDGVYTNNNEKYVIATSASANGSTEQKAVKIGIATEDYVEITEGVSEGDTIQLPQLATGSSSSSSSSSNSGGMMQGMGSLGGMTGGGGMPPSGAPNGGSGN